MVYESIDYLINYALEKELIRQEDVTYSINRLLEILELYEYKKPESVKVMTLTDALGNLCDYAVAKGMIEDGVVYRDLFDTKLMGALTPRPSEVIDRFKRLYSESPAKATEFYYKFSGDTNYIRRDRIAKDVKWKTQTQYGEIDITINLSKPEKDPKAIAAAKTAVQTGYPKCALCRENEGYSGHLNAAARQNHRVIPITINGAKWGLQYSPYVYYNEHCICFNFEHTPMKIDRSSFVKLLDFVKLFPHYFIGSNADLPIVGGSILSHDHFQGGHYDFAMAKAPVEKAVTFTGYEDVDCGIVKWPLSVIRISSENSDRLVDLADKILNAWRGYSDSDAFIFAETDGEPHNTITPIARKRGDRYELDLVLRNNITTKEHPLGVFHPHAELHNIKKENIGLIEVMGLAVLPARLKTELAKVAELLVEGKDLRADPLTEKHAEWVDRFIGNYSVTPENVDEILRQEVGKSFTTVLEHAGVYKCTAEGRQAFMRFIDSIGHIKIPLLL